MPGTENIKFEIRHKPPTSRKDFPVFKNQAAGYGVRVQDIGDIKGSRHRLQSGVIRHPLSFFRFRLSADFRIFLLTNCPRSSGPHRIRSDPRTGALSAHSSVQNTFIQQLRQSQDRNVKKKGTHWNRPINNTALRERTR
jgi:hypothetical protein